MNEPDHSIDDSSDTGFGHGGHHFGQQIPDEDFRHARTGSFGQLEGVEQFIQRTFTSARNCTVPL